MNLFFVEDYTASNNLGNSAGIPGSQGVKGGHNGVLINLSAHLVGKVLDDQLLGETAGHEMGHFLGLYHTTESNGTEFDPIEDTLECSNPGSKSAIICENRGGNNLMFWTPYSEYERYNNGKKQENLSLGQFYVLQHAPIAN